MLARQHACTQPFSSVLFTSPLQFQWILLIIEIHEIHKNHEIRMTKNRNPRNPA